MKISAIIPTYNEEVNIEDAIKSVSFADEIIVVDSYSTDNTVKLAKKHDIRLIERVFDDFSKQKNYAIDQASHDWIYILDADERVTPALREEILQAVKTPNDLVGYYVYRVYYFMERKLNYGGTRRDKVVRLFLKNDCRYNGDLVHEVIETDGKLGSFKNKLNHYSFRDFDHYVSKLNQYSSLHAEQLHQKNKKVGPYHVLIKPPVRFFTHYFIRLGFLDGFPGFIMAAMYSYAILSRYIRLWFINHKLK